MSESGNRPIYTGNDVVADAIAASRKADELREIAIAKLLAQRGEIEQSLKTLGYSASAASGNGHRHTVEPPPKPHSEAVKPAATSKRFRKMTLAQVGRILLQEYETLHGKVIEEMARAGGYRGGTENFQNYLAVALKRDGGFVNRGKNNWSLKGVESETKRATEATRP